jgi:hypothetical protein
MLRRDRDGDRDRESAVTGVRERVRSLPRETERDRMLKLEERE